MMEELNRGQSRHLQPDSSRSNSFSSQIPSEGANTMFQMAHLPEVTTSTNRVPLTVANDEKPILKFLQNCNTQSGPVATGKEIALKDGDMHDSNQTGLSKRMFDLQLPADVYVDSEEVTRLEKETIAESSSVTMVPLDKTPCSDPQNSAKLNPELAKGSNHREERWKSDVYMRIGSTTQNLADLNKPARELFFGKVYDPISAKFPGPRTALADNDSLRLPMRSNTNILGMPTDFLKGRHCDEGTSSKHLHTDDEEASGSWPFFNNKAGKNPLLVFGKKICWHSFFCLMSCTSTMLPCC